MPSTARARNRRRGRPPATPSHETRARILRAARRCFAETGYSRATNKQIAAAAGVTAAALYKLNDHQPATRLATARKVPLPVSRRETPHARRGAAQANGVRVAVEKEENET